MDVKFWFYVFLFAIFGVPLVGYLVRNIIRFGSYVYKKFPFLQRFFDDYFDHYAIGFVITAVTLIGYGILRWLEFV